MITFIVDTLFLIVYLGLLVNGCDLSSGGLFFFNCIT